VRSLVTLLAALLVLAAPAARAGAPPMRLFWTDRDAGRIRSALLDGSDVKTVVAALPGPQGLAVDPIGGRLYWADTTEGAIRSSRLDGSDVSLVRAGVGFPTGIAVDPIARMVYWCDPAFGRVQRAAFAPGPVETILTGLSAPQALAVDPEAGRLSVAAGNTGIFSATLAGDDLTLLTPSFDGQSVTLDLTDSRCTLFWAAAGRLTFAPVAGGEGANLPPITGNVTGLALDSDGVIYWAEDGPVFRHDPDANATTPILPASAGAWRLAVGPEVAPPTIRTPPASQAVPAGDPVVFSIDVDGSGPLQYQWRRDAVPLADSGVISGATAATLALASAGVQKIGVYDCVVSGPGGAIVSPPAVLGVRPSCLGDLVPDGRIDSQDLSALLALWGPCATGAMSVETPVTPAP